MKLATARTDPPSYQKRAQCPCPLPHRERGYHANPSGFTEMDEGKSHHPTLHTIYNTAQLHKHPKRPCISRDL